MNAAVREKLSADQMVAEITKMEPPAIAQATAAGVIRSAEQVIEDIQNQRTEARRRYEEFDAACTEAQESVRAKSREIAKQAEGFITALATNSLAVRKIGNDVATFGGGA